MLKRTGQPLRRNIVQAGNKGEARNCKTPTEAQNLIFSDTILQKVSHHTDEEIARRMATYEWKMSYSNKTTIHEQRAFVGLLHDLGILKAGHENVKEIWSESLGSPVFRETRL